MVLGIPGAPFPQPQRITPESEAANWFMASLSVFLLRRQLNVGPRFSTSRSYLLVLVKSITSSPVVVVPGRSSMPRAPFLSTLFPPCHDGAVLLDYELSCAEVNLFAALHYLVTPRDTDNAALVHLLISRD